MGILIKKGKKDKAKHGLLADFLASITEDLLSCCSASNFNMISIPPTMPSTAQFIHSPHLTQLQFIEERAGGKKGLMMGTIEKASVKLCYLVL